MEGDTVAEVAARMGALQVRRLPVLNRDEWLVGIVALGDLALLGEDKEATAEALREVSEPAGEPALGATGIHPTEGGARGDRGGEREPSDLAADEAARGGGGVGSGAELAKPGLRSSPLRRGPADHGTRHPTA